MSKCCVVQEHSFQVLRVGNRVHTLLQSRWDRAEHWRRLEQREKIGLFILPASKSELPLYLKNQYISNVSFSILVTVPVECLELEEASPAWTGNPALAPVERCHIQAQNPWGKHPGTMITTYHVLLHKHCTRFILLLLQWYKDIYPANQNCCCFNLIAPAV